MKNLQNDRRDHNLPIKYLLDEQPNEPQEQLAEPQVLPIQLLFLNRLVNRISD